MSNIIIVSTSLRSKSSSYSLATKIKEVASKNNNVELIDLKGFNLKFCQGCLACQKTSKCILDDDMKNVLDVISNADKLVFVTPIYYYAVSGQLKTFLDRLNPLYVRDNKFKEVYLVTTCADDNISALDGPKQDIEGFVSCFDGVKFVDSFAALNINSYEDLLKSNYLSLIENFAKSL